MLIKSFKMYSLGEWAAVGGGFYYSMLLHSEAGLARILSFDRVAVTARPLDLCHALIALVAILDAMAVPVFPLDHRQAVRPFVPIFDRVAI